MADAKQSSKVDISGDGGVFKELLREGVGDEKPTNGCMVSVHYTGKLVDGTVFDSSYNSGEPIEFTVGKGMYSSYRFSILIQELPLT